MANRGLRLLLDFVVNHTAPDHPIAEVYWDMEWELQQEGFDYTYDIRTPAGWAELSGTFFALPRRSRRSPGRHGIHSRYAPPAAVITFFLPGIRFFHEGQFEGRQVHASVHLGHSQVEPVDHELQSFYLRMLECLRRSEVQMASGGCGD
jgi:hypothetical protein